jgi:formylglycine-generating enzyme required for sulfatase activity
LAGLAGNVARVLRGGSYNNEGSNLRCAYRNNNNPNNRNDNNGFRVVVSSFMLLEYEGYQGLPCVP